MSANLTKFRALKDAGAQTMQYYLKQSAAEAPKYINKVRDDVIYKNMSALNMVYTRLLGLDEVRLYQERVVALQEKLLGVQERRRDIGQQLIEVRKKSTDLQDQIHKVKRNEDLQRFLDLMRDETEILKLEKDINSNFIECDREEREVFTAFTNAVRDSHEKQRAQLEYTKYFGLILSILGSFLAFCYSSLRKHDLKKLIEENLVLSYTTSQPLLLDKLLNTNEIQVDKVKDLINAETVAILKRIDSNYNAIIQVLSEPGYVDTKDNSDKIFRLLGNPIGSNIVPDRNTAVLYSCVAIVGIFILHKLFG